MKIGIASCFLLYLHQAASLHDNSGLQQSSLPNSHCTDCERISFSEVPANASFNQFCSECATCPTLNQLLWHDQMDNPIGLSQYSCCWIKFYPNIRSREMVFHRKFGKRFPAGGRIYIGKQNTNAYY